MLAEIAAANAAFAVIKTAIQNGRELADVAHKIGDYVNATEDLRKKGERKKRKGNTDLEEFLHLEKLKQQEEELKQWMIYAGRPNLWSDWQKFQANARKKRLAEAEAERKRQKKIIEITIISALMVVLGVGIVALIWWALYLKGL
jgi:hypothetical protein